MGWREWLFGSRISSQICTVAKSGSFVRKQKSAAQTDQKSSAQNDGGNKRTSFRSPITTTSLSTASATEYTKASTAVISAAAAAAVDTSTPPPRVIGIDAAFAVACTHPPGALTSSTTKVRQCNSSSSSRNSGVAEDALSVTSTFGSSPICRICQDKRDEKGSDKLVAPCGCAGSTKYVHLSCLNKWTAIKGSSYCEICEQPYNEEYVKIPCCSGSSEDNIFATAFTIVLLLLGVTAAGAYLLVDQVIMVASDTVSENDNEPHEGDIWVSISLIVSGLTGIILFCPYFMYCCIILCQLRVRRRRRARVTPQAINV